MARAKNHRRRLHALTGLVLLGTTLGCVSAELVPPPIVSKATLGSVIIYRNGVAYFERYAMPDEKELTIRVPAARVDDFLKSLTVVDEKTGDTMPVSYPTMQRDGGDVVMAIKLPERHHRLRISYVTESPAWKPSYRLVLGDDKKARLQGWAVVDNVSGEDWKDVRVGVGSTSALSFRYDLHSVRLVDRETLSSGSLLAAAPPTGGSPYGVDVTKARVVADLSADAISGLEHDGKKDADEEVAGNLAGGNLGGGKLGGGNVGESSGTGAGYGRGGDRWDGGIAPNATAKGRRPKPQEAPTSAVTKSEPPDTGRSEARGWVVGITNQLRGSNERVRVEGYAQAGDKDPRVASLDRANRLRDALIANGVDPAQIEAIGTGELNDQQAVRVVALDGDAPAEPAGSEAAPPAEAEPSGQAHFLASAAMTIARDHSAMVSILQATTEAERVYFYDPISPRGSKSFAFNAVRLVNPSEYTLDSGPITVYAADQFLGEGLSEPILPKGVAFVPYALDRNVVIETEITGRDEIERLLTIQRGIANSETRQIRRTRLTLVNRGSGDAAVYVRHQVQPGYNLSTFGPEVAQPEKLGGAHLFRVAVKGGESVDLAIEEWTPIRKTIDINGDTGIEAIGLWLKKPQVDGELAAALREIVRRHTERADLMERIATLEDQLVVYRARTDEINGQLVALKKLPQGERLRQHLSDKMEEISDKLQASTMELAELKGQLMTLGVELEDKLAELTLATREEKEEARR
jgi:hypothetical protein